MVGRFIRIGRLPVHGSAPTPCLNLDRVQVFGPAGAEVIPIAATLSSTESENTDGGRCISGGGSGLCHSQCNGVDDDPWLRVDLGAELPISRIIVQNRADVYGERIVGATIAITTVHRWRYRATGTSK